MHRITERLTYANVMATAAVFIALGGSAYAGVTLGKNSVRSKHIRNGQVKKADLGKNAVRSAKVKDGSLLASDFAAGQLPQGAPGPKGDPGVAGPKGDPGAPATRLFAYVGPAGTLIHGSGATSAERINTGRYVVTFDRDLSGCVAMAQVGMAYPAGPATESYDDNSTHVIVEENRVQVRTRRWDSPSFIAYDLPVQLAVFC